ncbi:unnamed protein product, partial [Ilex paraguariensis]
MHVEQNHFACGWKIPGARHIRMSRTISCPWYQGKHMVWKAFKDDTNINRGNLKQRWDDLKDKLGAFERWSHRETLPADAHKKVRLTCSYCKRHNETEVPDPYHGGSQGFEK